MPDYSRAQFQQRFENLLQIPSKGVDNLIDTRSVVVYRVESFHIGGCFRKKKLMADYKVKQSPKIA